MSTTITAAISALALVLSSGTAFAARTTEEERTKTDSVSTVAAAKEMDDDTHVTLRGNVIEHIRSDHYTFRDSTGDIQLEVDEDKWGNLFTDPMSVVEVTGVVDKGLLGIEIDVMEVRRGFDSGTSPPFASGDVRAAAAHDSTTVAAVKEMKDETPVTLQGYLEFESRAGDEFEFRDETGTITVNIEEDKWKGLVPNPGGKFEISGVVDRGVLSTEIEVHRIRKISDTDSAR